VLEGSDRSSIRTAATGGTLREVSITLDSKDLSPLSARFVFDSEDWVEITPSHEAPPEAAHAPIVRATVGTPPLEPSIAERELLTRLAIDRAAPEAGEPIEVAVASDGGIVVTVYGLRQQREDQLRASIAGIPRVSLQRAEQIQPQASSTPAVATNEAAIDASNAITSHAHLLQQFAASFPRSIEITFSPELRSQLASMRARHARALCDEIEALAAALTSKQPLFPLAPESTGVTPDANTLLDSATAVNRLVTGLYASGTSDNSITWRQLGPELARLRSLARRYAEESGQ
jgi:hypothetical protein